MSIKRKIVLLTTLWLVGILIAVNLTVYFSFLRATTDNELDLLKHRAETLLQKAPVNDLMSGRSTELLQSYVPEKGMIRLLDGRGNIVQTVQIDAEGIKLEPEAVTSLKSDLYHQEAGEILVIRLPVVSNNEPAGTLEMAEKLGTLEEYISTLISILTLSTLGAIGTSLIGGAYLSRWILRPISRSVRVMEEIERSLVFSKIPVQDGSKDELHAMASTFNRMVDRLEESFLRQRQFVSDASHELKTPITIIEGYANMLRRWGLKDEESAREAVDAIYTEAVWMKQMTEQLLDLASTEIEQALQLERIEMVSFCGEAAEMLRKLYRRDIKVITASDPLYLTADALKMKQILLILLDNALKYSKDSIELSISEVNDGTLRVDGVKIRVRDRGIGIPKEELPRVFERFYRVDPSRYRKTGGTGLGLSIARNLIKQQGGTIEIQSEEHVGTEVILFFPSPPPS